MERLKVDLEDAEYLALAQLAEQHLRPIPMEAHYLIREALVQAGLVPLAPDVRPE